MKYIPIIILLMSIPMVAYPQGNSDALRSPKDDSVSATLKLRDSIYVNQLKPILYNAVPELVNWEVEYRKKTGGKYDVITYIARMPDSRSPSLLERNYFLIYVAQEGLFTNHTYERFMIHKDTKEVLWYDLPNDTCFTLREWRSRIKSH